MFKKTTNTLLTLLLISIALTNCKKKNNPSGANIIRYKVNGQQIEISGKYNSLSKTGVGFSDNPSPYNSYIIDGSSNSTAFLLGISKTFTLNTSITTKDNVFNFSHKGDKGRAYTRDNTGEIIVTNNNANYISGIFKATIYFDAFNQTPGDSLKITDGYFDIAKQ